MRGGHDRANQIRAAGSLIGRLQYDGMHVETERHRSVVEFSDSFVWFEPKREPDLDDPSPKAPRLEIMIARIGNSLVR